MITVLELLILQERGILSMYDSPLKWFPHWNISEDVTLEALASHMAGLGRDRSTNRFTWNPTQGFTGNNEGHCGGPGMYCPTAEAIDIILGSEPDFPVFAQPSCTFTVWHGADVDSNDGFVLLGQIIEAAHGLMILCLANHREGQVIRRNCRGGYF
jgi:CubicO group peptidase (beta-lactamase class C family)